MLGCRLLRWMGWKGAVGGKLFYLLPLSTLLLKYDSRTPRPGLRMLASYNFASVGRSGASFACGYIGCASSSPSPVFIGHILLSRGTAYGVASSIKVIFSREASSVSFSYSISIIRFGPRSIFGGR